MKKNVIVVGGGIAGLTAAAYLGKAGFNVILIEKNKELGGLVNTIEDNNFKFDTGVRALLDAGIILPMLKELDIKLDIVKSTVSVGIEKDIINIEKKQDLIKYKDLLIKHYPESNREISKLIKIIKKIMRLVDILYQIENPIFKDILKDKRYLLTKLLPWLPKFLYAIFNINRLYQPVEEYLDRFINNQSLKDMIYQHFFKNTPTFFALSYFSLYLNYFYPEGGVGQLAKILEEKLIKLKVDIKRQTKITQIHLDKKVVIDQNNNSYNYDYLIWAADLRTFYEITKLGNISEKIKLRFDKNKNKILSGKGNDTVFTLFLEVDESPKTFAKISNGHFFCSPSKAGLGKVNKEELNEVLSNFEELGKEKVLNWLNSYIELNTFEISIPVLKDKNMAPDGKTGVIISILTDYELFKKAQDSNWLDEFILAFENKIIDTLTNTIYPFLKDKIIKKFSFSPLSIEKRIGSYQGSIVGWTFTQKIPVINRIQDSSKAVLTPFANIFQAGQWIYSPAGVPMCILTGKLAADNIIKKEK